MFSRATVAIIAALFLIVPMQDAWAWGAKGHRMIAVLAVKGFPTALPAFLRSPTAMFQIGELAREPDRSRDAGHPHDDDRDPGHFIDVADDQTILGGPALASLPATRQDYDTALRTVNSTQYKAGWLPYSIIDGWQQLAQDFVIWRADRAGEKFAKNAAERKWFAADRQARELLTIRDLGVWAHFVGDASQPMHATVHYNGWGPFPNPEEFRGAPNFHARFESNFVDLNINQGDVGAAMTPLHLCQCAIAPRTSAYLAETQAQVLTAFRLDKALAFDQATPEAKAFVAKRLAAGASTLRDMVADAWAASENGSLGYQPAISLKDIEAGKADVRQLLQN